MGDTERGLALLAGGAVTVTCCGALGAGSLADSSFSACPMKVATGLPCPFCGVTRGLVALGSGDFDRSVELAPLAPLVLLAAVAFLGFALVATRRRLDFRLPPAISTLGIVVIAAGWAAQLATPGSP